MIDQIKTVALDITGLSSNREIENYIPTQLIKHHPDPGALSFHYTVTGNRDRRSALVSYIQREKVNGSIKLKYPTLLFESKLKKCGHYIFIFSKTLLEVHLKDRSILSTRTLKLTGENLDSLIEETSTLIYDRESSYIVKGLDNRSLELEKLYKSCRTSLFKRKRRSPIFPIAISLTLLLVSLISVNLFNKYREAIEEYNKVKSQYTSLVSESNREGEIETKYNELLEEHYLLKSGIHPDLYTVIYELSSGEVPKRIMNLNYSDYGLNLNILTTNGIELTKGLNLSPTLNLRQNSSVSQNNYEIVSISGEVICP